MTEEKAGSDASAIGFLATRVDEHYLLNGEKIFISNSGLADIYTILVNTKGIKGPRSFSVFIVENGTPGFSIGSLPEKDGLKALPTGRLIFKDVSVPRNNMIGEEGTGLLINPRCHRPGPDSYRRHLLRLGLPDFPRNLSLCPPEKAIRPSLDQQPGHQLPDRRHVLQNECGQGACVSMPWNRWASLLPAELFPGQTIRHPDGYGCGRQGTDIDGRQRVSSKRSD